MKLDSRILEGKKPLDCFDVEEAKQFIGKECYFSNYLCNFNNINSIAPRALLHNITEDKDASNPYYSCPGYFAYCLPCEWVEEEKKEPEEKYRPYTVMEFIKEYPLGSHLHFRPKDKLIEMHRLIDGYNDCLNGAGTLFMCGRMYLMSELYNNYEICINGEWQPFGIKE